MKMNINFEKKEIKHPEKIKNYLNQFSKIIYQENVEKKQQILQALENILYKNIIVHEASENKIKQDYYKTQILENKSTNITYPNWAEYWTSTTLTQVPEKIRINYENEVNRLKEIALKMSEEGYSPEETAISLHGLRRHLGVKYKTWTPQDKLQEIYERNIKKYGDKYGPTIDYFINHDKSWEDIIKSATRSGGKDLGF